MHYRFASALALLASGLITGIASADPEHTYLEDDGIVLFEVEDAESVEGWVLKTDLEGYGGSGYLEWSGPNSFPVSSAGAGTITYHFRIQTAGNYQLRWRSQIATGESNTESNDSWLRLATGIDIEEQHSLNGWTKVFMNTLGSWSWTARTVDHVGEPIRQYFAQGDHTLELSGRSIGHAIDRIALYRYDDINFNESMINAREPSAVVQGDGTVVDPNETPVPEPDTTDPESTPPVVPVERQNLFIADPSWAARANHECSNNTLALPASLILSVDPADPDSDYLSAEYLTISGGSSSALLMFDLSLVPPAENVVIEYSTGTQTADGNFRYSLGSHSEWSDVSDSTVQQPNVMLELSQAIGGFDAQTRYQSTLPADLLVNGTHTIIISSDTGSAPVDLFAKTGSDLTPRLILSGNGNFCRDWQVNMDASNASVEPPPEVEVEAEVEAEVTPPNLEPETQSKTVTTGGSLSWLLLWVFTLAIAVKSGLQKKQAARCR